MGEALRSNIKDFQIIHLHSVFLWPTTVAARVAWNTGTPYILSPHGMLVRQLIRRKSWMAKCGWIALFERRNIKLAMALHVSSEIELEEVTKLGFKPKRVALVPNGLDLPAHSKEVFSATNAWVTDWRPPMVLFLGRVSWKKGLDCLITAFSKVPNAELVVAGNDEEKYSPTLLSLATKFGLSERVRFIGHVSGAEKWHLLRKARLVVLPSRSENFGIVILEAMAVGCPVVVTPEVGLATTVSKVNAGIVVDSDPEKLAAAIRELLNDRDKSRRMGAAGVRIAAESFSWDTVAEQMERVYEECLDANR
jgi:glycosyltransferase involved in cell wall biosynthesis